MLKNNYNKIKNFDLLKNRAFTLVELMVTISIFLIITSVTIVNYSSFKSNVSLQNLTDDIALSIRKAQSFAIGARAVDQDFNKSYGIHFSADENTNGVDGSKNKSFLIFSVPKADITAGYTDKDICTVTLNCIELFKITSTDKIKEISIVGGSNNGNDKNESIDIIFTRPDPRARFCYTKSSGVGYGTVNCDSGISSASIVISNGKTGDGEEKTKTITVQNTGQISIQ